VNVIGLVGHCCKPQPTVIIIIIDIYDLHIMQKLGNQSITLLHTVRSRPPEKRKPSMPTAYYPCIQIIWKQKALKNAKTDKY